MKRNSKRATRSVLVESLEDRLLFTAIPSDGTPITLTGVKAGNTITIQASITTDSDPNEDGEGEPLVITSSSGASFTDSTFNVQRAFTFTAGADDEVITATIPNADGDEVTAIDASFTAIANKKYSQTQKDDYAKMSADLNIAAAGAATIAAGLIVAPEPAFSKGGAAAVGVTGGLLWLASAYYGRLALDPPDSNFMSIAKPSHAVVTPTHSSDFKGIKNAGSLAASVNAFNSNVAKSLSLAAAAFTTANRVDGADAASNSKWSARQLKVLNSYKKQQAKLLGAQSALLNRESSEFAKAGIGTTAVTSDDVQSFESNVLSNGLPADIVATLTRLGADSATIAQIQQSAFVQDTTLASGTYQSILTNATLQADLKLASAALVNG